MKDIHWPDQIEDAEKTLRVASLAMVVFYIVGVGFAGIAIFAAVLGVFTDGRLSALANFFVDVVSKYLAASLNSCHC